MPLTDYNRRPASALGVSGINLLAPAPGSNWKSSTARGTTSITVERNSGDYDIEELDFEAYQRRKFPNAAGGEVAERTTSALGMAGPGALSSNENLGTLHTCSYYSSAGG
jgi:hypothetical protein